MPTATRLFTPAMAVLPLAALLPGQTAAAATFSVIATPGGQPAIGAFHGQHLYGTDPYGGTGSGRLFSLTMAGGYTVLHDFAPATDGATPNAKLTVESSGVVSGTAQSGGANGGGTIFRYSKAGGFAVAHAFGGGSDGTAPLQGPSLGAGGAIWGSTSAGAIATNGNLFSLSLSGGYTVQHNFMSGEDGHCPFSGVSTPFGSAVYGTTVGRGFGGQMNGSVWKFVTGTLTTLYAFTNGKDGEWPDQAPVADPKGNIFGTTHVQNGSDFAGAIWKIDGSGKFLVLHAMAGASDGYAPNSPLVLNKDGYLYGTTRAGGSFGFGTVFRMSRTGAFSVVHAFSNGKDGATPTGSLVHDASGALYGGTATGVVYRIVP